MSAALSKAAQTSGLSRREIRTGYLRLGPRRQGMLLREYIANGLHLIEPDARQDFVGAARAAHICQVINRVGDIRGLVADKLLFDQMLGRFGFRVPELQGCFGRQIDAPNLNSMPTQKELKQFFLSEARFPIFAKPQLGQQSKGIFVINGFEQQGNLVDLDGREPVHLKDFIKQVRAAIGTSTLMLQSKVRQHSEISKRVGDTLATLRIVTYRHRKDYYVHSAFWKIPRIGQLADNVWRGGLLGSVDAEKGLVGALSIGANVDFYDKPTHPDTGKILNGFEIPFWQEAVETAKAAASLMPNLPLIGWDIGIAEDGPVIVEANSTPSLDQGQFINQRGVYSGEIGGFLRQEYETVSNQRGSRRLANITKRINRARSFLKG